MNQDINNQKSKLSNKKFWYVFTLPSVITIFYPKYISYILP